MINQISVRNNKIHNNIQSKRMETQTQKNAVSFRGIPPEIINISIIDLATAILPRTWVDAKTNGFAAAETFRRESSGLIVNCLIPGFIVYGVAKLLELFSPKNKGLANKWANEQALETLQKQFISANGGSISFTNKILNSIEVLDGRDWIPLDSKQHSNLSQALKNRLASFSLESEKQNFARIMANANATKKEKADAVNALVRKILEQTRGEKNIRVAGQRYHADLHTLLRDAMDVGQDFIQHKRQAIQNVASRVKNITGKERTRIITEAVTNELNSYVKQSKKFINNKSLLGLAIVIPLAASMQSINRWITRKTSGQEGAPIYKNFGIDQKKKEMSAKEKSKFWINKLMAAGLMVAVGYASLKDKSIKNIFKGLQFTKNMPTMDQCRWIATTTFASRMLASEDNNELKEVKWRDIATFASLYFLGDYVAKGVGSLLQKFTKTNLLNYTKIAPQKTGNIIRDSINAIKHWTSGTELKTFAEATKISSKAKSLRGVCEASSLGFSMLILGMLVPWYVRKQTERKVQEELKNKYNSYHLYPSLTTTGKKTFQAFGMMLKD